MTPTYNKLQQVFSLNQIANAAADRTGSRQELQDYATQKIKAVLKDPKIRSLIGVWKLVWGPVVYQFPGSSKLPASHVADNTMFVAQRMDGEKGTGEYVVAIAGTNPVSWFGWFVEDFTLNPTVDWPYGSDFGGLKPKISQGTSVGLGVLLDTMKDGGATLTDFLGQVTAGGPGPFDVAVSGHSLGGALSAATALALVDLQGKNSGKEWDPGYEAVVSAVPSAGPTPGNADFAQYYDQRIGTRTNRIWNVIDIVPHAWQLDMLEAASHLYYPYLVPNVAVTAFTGLAIANSIVAGDMKQINLQTPALASQVDLSQIFTPESPLAQVEISLVNAVIESIGKKLGLPEAVIELIEKYVDEKLAKLTELLKAQGHATLAEAVAAESATAAKLAAVRTDAIAGDLLDLVNGLLAFLFQAGWQHTAAYPDLMGTSAFKQRAGEIQPKPAG